MSSKYDKTIKNDFDELKKNKDTQEDNNNKDINILNGV